MKDDSYVNLNWTGRLSTGLFLIEISMNLGMEECNNHQAGQQLQQKTTNTTENNSRNREQTPCRTTAATEKVHIYNAVFLTGYLFYMTGV